MAKPTTHSNKEEEFHEWRRKLLNYVGAVPGFTKVKEMLNLSAAHEGYVSILELHSQITDVEVETLKHNEQQIYTILDNVTTGESQDIVSGSGDGSGFEAWRRLNARWDPHTANRAGS